MIVAIIPARGGSKRIPGKNIKLFRGRPIISYSLEAAQKAGAFDRILVSTDSEDIATIAREYGAETPFVRPAELADDYTATAPVLLHALQWLTHNGGMVEAFCCIYPAAPFIRAEDIRSGLEKLTTAKAGAVIPVTTFPAPIFRAFTVNEGGWLQMLWPEHELTRSNDLPEAYHDAGQFYWCDAEKFLQEKKIYMDNAMPLILPRYRVQDLDTLEDWSTAELMYEILQRKRMYE